MTRSTSRAKTEIRASGADFIPGPARDRQGFAIIISVVVISGIALIASLTAALLFMSESHETGDRVSAIQARSSAFSCADIAMLRLKQNHGYTGSENVSVDKVNCTINPVVAAVDARTVHARAETNGLISRIKVEVADINEFFLNSWTEIPP